jgi:hypothetical protein
MPRAPLFAIASPDAGSLTHCYSAACHAQSCAWLSRCVAPPPEASALAGSPMATSPLVATLRHEWCGVATCSSVRPRQRSSNNCYESQAWGPSQIDCPGGLRLPRRARICACDADMCGVVLQARGILKVPSWHSELPLLPCCVTMVC